MAKSLDRLLAFVDGLVPPRKREESRNNLLKRALVLDNEGQSGRGIQAASKINRRRKEQDLKKRRLNRVKRKRLFRDALQKVKYRELDPLRAQWRAQEWPKIHVEYAQHQEQAGEARNMIAQLAKVHVNPDLVNRVELIGSELTVIFTSGKPSKTRPCGTVLDVSANTILLVTPKDVIRRYQKKGTKFQLMYPESDQSLQHDFIFWGDCLSNRITES